MLTVPQTAANSALIDWDMRSRLVELGYWEEQLRQMTPEQALAILADPSPEPDSRQLCPILHWAVARELWCGKSRVWWANVQRSFLIDTSRAGAWVPLLDQVPIGISASKWRRAVWELNGRMAEIQALGWSAADLMQMPILSFAPARPADPLLRDEEDK